jgi:hypothetical protein
VATDWSDLLDQLERQKKDAVQREDYAAAEQIKQQIDRFRRSFDQVTQLQKEKNDAVQREDYATAERLKNQITALLSGQPQQSYAPRQVRQQQQQVQPERVSRRPVREPSPEPPPEPVKRAKPQKTTKPVEEAPRAPVSQPPQSVDTDERPIRPAPLSPVVPAGATVMEYEQTEPEPLKLEHRQAAGLLLDLFEERPIACFFSAAWNLRKDGIEELANLICGLTEQALPAFKRFVVICKARLEENIQGPARAAFDAIQKIAETLHVSNADLTDVLGPIIPAIKAKLALPPKPKLLFSKQDSGEHKSPGMAERALEFAKWMVEKEQWEALISMMTQPLKNPSHYRVALSQLQLMRAVIMAKKSINAIPGLHLPLIMAFLSPCLESGDKDVRQLSVEIMVLLHLMVGSSLRPYIERLGTVMETIVNEAIAQADNDED